MLFSLNYFALLWLCIGRRLHCAQFGWKWQFLCAGFMVEYIVCSRPWKGRIRFGSGYRSSVMIDISISVDGRPRKMAVVPDYCFWKLKMAELYMETVTDTGFGSDNEGVRDATQEDKTHSDQIIVLTSQLTNLMYDVLMTCLDRNTQISRYTYFRHSDEIKMRIFHI